MYISFPCLSTALSLIGNVHPFFGMSFLAFKKAALPVGETKTLNFTRIVTDVMEQYYRPIRAYDGYYNPFFTSDTSDRWVKKRYPSTSLQRITADTFSDALIHEKGSQNWGWQNSYVDLLAKHLRTDRIPAFPLACWLYRDRVLPNNFDPQSLINLLFVDFGFSAQEAALLFDESHPNYETTDWLSTGPIDESDIQNLLGRPPGLEPDAGVGIARLTMEGVGPADEFDYLPSERLNLLTGDNSLGKTFVLDCVWWALTGTWFSGQAALPKRTATISRISFEIATGKSTSSKHSATFDKKLFDWEVTGRSRTNFAGIALYAKHDGSFAIWDPAVSGEMLSERKGGKSNILQALSLSRDQVWYGKPRPGDPGDWLCNGLLRDWPQWQLGGKRYAQRWEALERAVLGLFATGDEVQIAEPASIRPGSSLELPTLQMPYGNVPLPIASAGVQRVAALAYILVWAWHRHLEACLLRDIRPSRRIAVLIDEVEAHLHPKWQRTIVPAVIKVANGLAEDVSVQFHLATHSPMVAASIEPYFSANVDSIHHLQLVGSAVKLDKVEFVKRGRSDLWLMSEVFGLNQPRSIEAEKAIDRALVLLAMPKASHDRGDVRAIDAELTQFLAPDDEFWPRWRFLAIKAKGRE